MSSFRCMAKKYLRAGLTSGTIMASGDLLCQTWERRRAASSGGGDGGDVLSDAAASTSGRLGAPAAVQEQLGVMPAYDLARTARFFAVGMTFHGPFFVNGFAALERVVGPATCLRAAAKKVALGHAFLFPTYTCGFYLYMSALEGKGVEGGWVKFKDTWWEVFVVGSSFWPVANMVNFKYVKPQYRLVYLNVAGLAWNSYLSYQNQRSNVAHPSLEDAETTTTTTTTRARVKGD